MHPDIWVEQLDHDLTSTVAAIDPTYVIIDDVRHRNEAQWIANNGGYLVRIEGSRAPLKIPYSLHVSETNLDGLVFAGQGPGGIRPWDCLIGPASSEGMKREGLEVAHNVRKFFRKNS